MELDVSYASLHTFSKVTLAISFWKLYMYIYRKNETPGTQTEKNDLQQYVNLSRHHEKKQLIKQQLLNTDIDIKGRL